jgi:hypothetical protein
MKRLVRSNSEERLSRLDRRAYIYPNLIRKLGVSGDGSRVGQIQPQSTNKEREREVPGAGNETLSRQTRRIPAAKKITQHKP